MEDTVLTPNALPHDWEGDFLSQTSIDSLLGSLSSGACDLPLFAKMKKSLPIVSVRACFPFSEDEALGIEREKTTLYDAAVTLSPGEELTLSEISGSGRLAALGLYEESLTALAAAALGGLIIRIYSDGGVRPSASVKLADLVKLGGKRPLNVSYAQSVRFVLVNEGGKAVTLEKLSIFISCLPVHFLT